MIYFSFYNIWTLINLRAAAFLILFCSILILMSVDTLCTFLILLCSTVILMSVDTLCTSQIFFASSTCCLPNKKSPVYNLVKATSWISNSIWKYHLTENASSVVNKTRKNYSGAKPKNPWKNRGTGNNKDNFV